MPAARPTRWDRARGAALALVLAAATTLFLAVVHRSYPLQHWLFWHYAGYWVGVLAFVASALSLGHVSLRWVLGRREALPLLEHLAVSFPVGVFAFELLVFLVGIPRLYGPVTFYLLPAFAIGSGAWWLLPWSRRVFRKLRAARRRAQSRSLMAWPVLAFGFLALALIYFLILTPENIQFDSRWKHMALAEQFTVHGGIRRFPEGYVFSARSHSTSFLYTWSFMMPFSRLFDRMLLSAHLEFAVFLWTTLIGIPAMVRRLIPRAPVALVWAARFVFPGVFLYDSSLSGGADHIGAMWCVPLLLLGMRSYSRPTLRLAALLGIAAAGAAMVKESVALMLVPGALILFGFGFGKIVVAKIRKREIQAPARWWLLPLTFAGAALVASAPHWLKNWIWYGDPAYPVLHKYFASRPWPDGADYFYRYGYIEFQMWRPERNLSGLWDTLKVLFTFSFIPNDWPSFHRDVPVFGSLFTLLVACLPFLKGTRRIWVVVGWCHLAIFIWYSVHHQDRYLQAVMPLMATATAATMVLIWRSGRYVVRGMLGVLVAAQLIWGGDVYFFTTHAMISAPIKSVTDLMESGFRHKYVDRYRVQGSMLDLRKVLPNDAVVLFHEESTYLGIGRTAINDFPTFQLGLSYGLHTSRRDTWEHLRSLGVTHIAWKPGQSTGFDTIAGDLRFFDFVDAAVLDVQRSGSHMLARMRETAPADGPGPSSSVLVVGCPGGKPPSGLFQLGDLRVYAYGPLQDHFPTAKRLASSPEEAWGMANGASFAVTDAACQPQAGGHLPGWSRLATRNSLKGSRRYVLWKSPTARTD